MTKVFTDLTYALNLIIEIKSYNFLKIYNNMKKKLLTIIFVFSTFIPMLAQKTFNITVTNDYTKQKSNVPIVIELEDYGMDVKSALVTDKGKEIACQLDDIDQDGRMDELCFITNVAPNSAKEFNITLYDKGKPRKYEPKVYVEMLLSNKKIKESNKQNLYITQLTVDNGTNPYWTLHHHGAAFENDMVAYRIYFDHRQTVDIYGKYLKRLELKETQFYPDKEQKAAQYGDDVLWVGSTLGLGTLRGWDGNAPTMLNDVDKRSQRIVSRGPIRTIVEVKDKGWTMCKGMAPIDMTTLYTLYAGRRECYVDVKFNKQVNDYRFATGFINVKNSTEFSDKKGLRGCWGTDWPVSAKDSIGHKRETVGLGIYIPEKYIVREEPANKDNYAYVIATDTDELHYKITFCSDNESFGLHSDDEWYKFLEEWKDDLSHPVNIK